MYTQSFVFTYISTLIFDVWNHVTYSLEKYHIIDEKYEFYILLYNIPFYINVRDRTVDKVLIIKVNIK